MTRSDSGVLVSNKRGFLTGALAAGSIIAAPWVRRADAADFQKIRMACWSPRLAEEGNIFVSEEKGFFREQGIEMEWVPGQGSGDALKNMLAGNADIAFVGPEAILLAADKGSKLKAVYNIYPENAFNVFALKSKKIVKPQDLKGKKIGVISMASGTRYNLATILALNGMSERDVELIAVGLNATPALASNQIDALASTDTILYGMQASGLGDVDVIWARDYVNCPTDIFTVEEKAAAAKKDLFLRFLKGYKKGMEYTIANIDEAAAITSKIALDGKDPVKVMGYLKLRIAISQSAGTREHGLGWFDAAPLQQIAKVYKDAGFIKTDIDMTAIANNDFVKAL